MRETTHWGGAERNQSSGRRGTNHSQGGGARREMTWRKNRPEHAAHGEGAAEQEGQGVTEELGGTRGKGETQHEVKTQNQEVKQYWK